MHELNLLLLGPPGAGKGTQAERLVADLGLAYVATGNMLRDATDAGTELGRTAKDFMDRGDLVPDELIIAMLSERLNESDTAKGFILDGFPRNEVQAEALDRQLTDLDRSLTVALLIDVPADDVVRRLSGRRECTKNRHTVHVEFDPPKHPDRCDLDGSRLIQRDDDKPEVVQKRLETYRHKTAPLIDYYDKRGMLRRVDGSRSTDEVSDQIRATLATLKFEEAV